MTLAAGTKLGPYEVISPLGAGGMGEVYRAKDTRLDREVAIKVLPEHLSANSELRQRFEREAKAISALTHPHICTLHDVGNQDGVEYLVMECIEGQSLATRLESGPLPPDQVIRYGTEIADALEAAHRQGIVHRDLKPGNVMLTRSGVKLLDFGLAKHRAAAVQSEISQLSSLPTELTPSRPALTEQGTIMGTFQYMAPEQLEGKDADARSDIFAFGCVLYETATGRKAFSGKSRASLIGSILKDQPAPISSIQPMTPPALDRLVQTCLAKEPDDRFQTAHDVKLQLQWIAEGGSQAGAPAVVVARRRSRERTAWAVAAAASMAAIALGIGFLRRAPAPKRVMRFEIPQPAGLTLMGAPKVSPDGRNVAFVGTDAQGKSELWLRSFDALTARPIAGTEGVTTLVRPFWSPDSRFVGYFVGDKLMKIPLDGGPPQKICDSPTLGDGTWSEDGTILFDGTAGDPIRRVAADGGIPKVEVATNIKGLTGVGWPQFLPGGRRFLLINNGGKEADNGVWIAELGGGGLHRVVSGLSRVEFAPPDELLFVRENTLVAQRIDPSSGKLRGDPIPVAEGVGIQNAGQADFSASRNGVLVYRAGQSEENRLAWIDVSNGHSDAGADLGTGRNPALSPDGRWLAVDRAEGKSQDIWLRDLKRGVSSRFTTDPKPEYAPLFTPDGKSLLYSRDEGGGRWAIVSRSLDSPDEKILVPAAPTQLTLAISPDGKSLLYQSIKGTVGTLAFGLFVTDLAAGGPGKAYSPSSFGELGGTFSPDGGWIAYSSNESGRFEVYVQAFPEPGRKWQISTDGGGSPIWAPDGHGLYYVAADRKLMRVDVKTAPGFDAGVPQALFPIALAPGRARNKILISPDGKRLLIMGSANAGASTPMTVVLDWNAAVRK
ncbi:MAG TPA: protein kinase [Thermoanaerobaculia bacterium]|nr:protein kinase [Thermoanaerobaculia bacterium]